ncbi:MAG: dihydroorotate dehydrogenase electron transfer subunit [Erysipelotrichaceae bacterium]|nr:dihydroorotate dehydrogenase electron transfer subunit [Erysipelotrichaceae bacterium]
MVENTKIIKQEQIGVDLYRMELQTSMTDEAKPGQFIQIQVPGMYLRRPISISEIKKDSLVIIYKVVGQGTKRLSEMEEGQTINVFGPLGNGFPIEQREHVVLVGGGVGVPPLYETAKQYRAQNTKVDVVLGFNDKEQIFYEEEFIKLGCSVSIATMDGSQGTKGTVINALKERNIDCDCILSCGPLPMLKALQNTYPNGYISLEARMACGIGACMGCVVKDQQGHAYRVCKDGPVFPFGKVVLS